MDTALAARWVRAYEKVEARCLGIAKDRYAYLVKSDSGNTYRVTGAGNVATTCSCPAGINGNPVCWHRAAVYALIGAFDHLRPRPEPVEQRALADAAMTKADRALLAYWSTQYDAISATDRKDWYAARAAINRGTAARAMAERFMKDAGIAEPWPHFVAANAHAKESARKVAAG